MLGFVTNALLSTTLIVMGVSLLAMIVIPVLPGQFIIWLAAGVYGLLAGWDQLGWTTFLLLTLLTLFAALFDLAAGWIGAKRGGASNKGIMIGVLGGLIGLIFFNALGALVGTIVGISGYEYLTRQDWREAWRASWGYLLGLLVSLIVRVFLSVVMVVIFAQRVL